MHDAKRVPENDVGVVDGFGAVTNPFGDAKGWLTRGLRDVSACGPDLIVLVFEVLAE